MASALHHPSSRLAATTPSAVAPSATRPRAARSSLFLTAMNSSLNPIVFALRHPITVMAAVAALAVTSTLAARRMAVDVFPKLDLPVIYIAQPYGGMDPAQMESQLTAFYEGHSIYIAGIHHVESKTIQGMGIVKLFFHPGTDMAQAIAE